MLIGNRIFNKMLSRYRRSLAMADSQSVNVAELAEEAKAVWLALTRAYYYDMIAFILWFIWVRIIYSMPELRQLTLALFHPPRLSPSHLVPQHRDSHSSASQTAGGNCKT